MPIFYSNESMEIRPAREMIKEETKNYNVANRNKYSDSNVRLRGSSYPAFKSITSKNVFPRGL